MDCVGCEKCRLWGKLQVLGLGTALKILFSVEGDNHLQPVSKANFVGYFELNVEKASNFIMKHVENCVHGLFWASMGIIRVISPFLNSIG